MRKIFILVFVALAVQSFGQAGFVYRGVSPNDTLWLFRSPADSVQLNRNARVWGTFTGTLSDQADLQSVLDNKQSTLVSATNIKTINGASVLGSGDLVVAGQGGITQQTLNDSTAALRVDLNGKLSANGIGSGLTGLTAGQVGLGNVTNESKATMFTNPTFTGTVTIPASQITNTMLAGSIATSKITGYVGYSINVQALTSSPADAGTVYFGMLPKAPVSAAATSKIYIRQAGTITAAEIYCYSGTAGTNEAWSLYIRVNNTTDNLIATLSVNTSERVFTNSSLSIAVNAGDYIEIKSVQPTWATNPLTTIYGGYIRIN